MRIAVTSQNFRTVTGHAGRARRFIVFEGDGSEPPKEVERLDLAANMSMHDYDPEASHPLDGVNVVITGGAGEGFVRRMAARGVRVVGTDESTPHLAVEAFFAGRVRPATVVQPSSTVEVVKVYFNGRTKAADGDNQENG